MPAAAAMPAVGQTVAGAIPLGGSQQIALPPGAWKVEAAFEEGASIAGTGQTRQAVQHLVLVNTEPKADIALIVLDFTAGARVDWPGQPCTMEPPNAVVLARDDFGTTTSSTTVKCMRLFPHPRLDLMARTATGPSAAAWVARRFGPLAGMADRLPRDAVMAQGYLSRTRGDRLILMAYFNPGLHGIGDLMPKALGVAPTPGALGQGYVAAVQRWGVEYLNELERSYLNARGGPARTVAFAFGGIGSVAALPGTSVVVPPGSMAVTPSGQGGASVVVPPGSMVVTSPAAAPTTNAQTRPVGGAPAVAPQRVHALVIGNAAYPGARLANPRNDAQAVAERFRRFGFKVTLLQDATRKQLVDALAAFSRTAADADVGIVFYAGHGIQVGGVNYLIPTDFDLNGARAVNVAFEAISLDTLLKEYLPGRTKLVFLDACRDNPLSRSLARTRGGSTGLAPIQAASGTLISYATRDGSTADDGEGRNSPYTTALLQHLDAEEDIALVLRKVRQQVISTTKGQQEPWEYGSLVGDTLVLSQIARAAR